MGMDIGLACCDGTPIDGCTCASKFIILTQIEHRNLPRDNHSLHNMRSPWRAYWQRFLAVCMPQHPFCRLHADGQNARDGGVVCLDGSRVDVPRKMHTEDLALQPASIATVAKCMIGTCSRKAMLVDQKKHSHVHVAKLAYSHITSACIFLLCKCCEIVPHLDKHVDV